EDTSEMLDALLSRLHGFHDRHRLRDMPGKAEPLLGGLVRNREERVAGQAVIDLDEVGTRLLRWAYSLAGFGRVRHGGRARPDRLGAIHNGAGDDEARAKQGALRNRLAPGVMPRTPPHQPHTCHSVGDEEWR